MSFSVTILGSGASLPTSTRGLTAQYVVCKNRHILIDCGEGTQMQVRKYGIKIQRIDHILISHLHGDHYFGLVGLLSSMHLLGRTREIHIYAHAPLKDIVELQLNHGGAKLAFELHFHTLEENGNGLVFEDDKITINYFPLKHKIPTNGFVIAEKQGERTLLIDKAEMDNVKMEYFHRLKKGEDVVTKEGTTLLSVDYTTEPPAPCAYAFCSDTRYAEEIIPFIQGVTALYHEATFTEQHIDRANATKHSSARQAAMIAKKANVASLYMGHISARYDDDDQHLAEAKEVFDNAYVVADGQVIQIAHS